MEKINIDERAEKARQLFYDGYNCAQSVVLAYCDYFDIDPSLVASISAPLGGGMGRLREVCGAVSGMFMVLGLYYKNDVPADLAKRKLVYTAVQELAAKSKELNGSIICREPRPQKRDSHARSSHRGLLQTPALRQLCSIGRPLGG